MITKLQKGQRVVLAITGVQRDVPSNYGPEVKFIGRTATDPDAAIFLKPDTAERQLSRLGLTLDTAVGQTLEFAKPDKFIDINRVGGQPAPAPQTTNGKQPFTSGAPIPGLDTSAPEHAPENGEAKAKEWARLCGLHKRCLAHVLDVEVPLLEEAKVGGSPESISALTAQLFIAATNAGLHR